MFSINNIFLLILFLVPDCVTGIASSNPITGESLEASDEFMSAEDCDTNDFLRQLHESVVYSDAGK